LEEKKMKEVMQERQIIALEQSKQGETHELHVLF
jgi:hypothetical protein